VSLSASDLFLSPDLTDAQARQFLESLGFGDPAAADHHLQMMADDLVVRQTLGSVADVLLDALLETPNPDAALVGFSRYLVTRTARTIFLEYLRDDPRALHVLANVLGTSPFLSEILIRNPEYFHWLVSQIDRSAPDSLEDDEEVEALLAGMTGSHDVINALKRLKRRETLRIAARDILGRDTLQSATAQLSDLAGLMADRALAFVSTQALAAAGRDRLPGTFVVIGMGKLGGRELNYSSDIDLIYVYDPDDQGDSKAHDFFHRLAKKLTAALSEHTEESYLYRVDLRLRPMGRRGNIAYSLQELEQYYNSWGETFERFALIKARPVAGDRALGRRFLELVQPFVYRKYLDHAALEEMHRHKTRMDRTLPRGEGDRNVKLGRGGIREVELFTQVLQLTYGGNQPELRQANTLAALDALRKADLISRDVCDDLSRAYVFLRTVEHRVQLVQEGHTHSLSNVATELEISARRLGFDTNDDLQAALQAHRDRVHSVYRDLFERRRGTSNFQGRQFFRILSEDIPDSEGLAHLSEYGLREPSAVLNAIRALGQAASAATAPSVARNVLANLLAVVMERIARCARPEQVLNRLEQVTAQTGAAALWFRSLLENEGLRAVLIQVLDSGDLLADRLVRHPELLDSLVQAADDIDTLRQGFRTSLDRMATLEREERMRQVRRFKLLEEFKILVEWLSGGPLDLVHEKLSLLAESCVERVASWHAVAASGRENGDPVWAIAALGRLGGTELTVHSDLDLVVLYDGDPDDAETFRRYQAFVQAMQAFFEEPVGETIAYRVDTRLRPEGSKGALAIPLAMFRRYLDTRAEIWERLVWTRCRLVAGSPRLSGEIQASVGAFVYGPWEPRIPRYMQDVRLRMERELAREGEKKLDFKVGRGGLADIDFALQLIQIREGRARPEFRVAGTRHLLATLPPSAYLTDDETEQLREAYRFLRSLEMVARMEVDADITWITPDPVALEPLGARLASSNRPGEWLLNRYRDVTGQVRSIYTAVLARLGSELPDNGRTEVRPYAERP
jgi:[glutamine synthetase] adenylyltransferase / [glutamine synthetase]-adenylyl-L-tyrosine phosphorylase